MGLGPAGGIFRKVHLESVGLEAMAVKEPDRSVSSAALFGRQMAIKLGPITA